MDGASHVRQVYRDANVGFVGAGGGLGLRFLLGGVGGRGSGLGGVGGARGGADLEHVVLAKGVLDEAGVELDNLLDGGVVGDADGKGLLDNHEGDALSARRGGEGTGVGEDVRPRNGGDDVAVVDSALDHGGAAGGGDLGEGRREGGDDRRGPAGGDFEHEGNNGQLGVVGDTLVHHVELERVVLAEDVVLGWGVHVELDKLERVVADCGGAVGYDLNGRAQVLEEDLIDLGDRDLGLVGSLGNGGINVDGRLVFAGLAGLVLGSERSPVEGTVGRTITKFGNLSALSTLSTLEHGEAVKAGCRSSGSEDDGLEKHSECGCVLCE